MNVDRRKRISEAADLATQARVLLEQVRDEESTAFENISEAVQNGDRGQAMEAAIDALEQAIDGLENVEGYCAEAAA